jgi:hypothetical protein
MVQAMQFFKVPTLGTLTRATALLLQSLALIHFFKENIAYVIKVFLLTGVTSVLMSS